MIRILCDRCVNQKYVDAFDHTDWITLRQVEDVFPNDAEDTDDGEISEYVPDGWV